MPRLAVLGKPIAHSRSPAMHAAALAELGLAPEWTYEAIEVDEQGFATLVRSLPASGFAGVNVTIPHKLAALAVANDAGTAARATGAANTLSFMPDGSIAAENTDAAGVIAALPGSPAGASALVMGAGGSARAAIWALREEGAHVAVWNRTSAKAKALAAEFGVTQAEAPETTDFEFLVNATSVGMEAPGIQAPEGQPLGGQGSADLKGLPIAADDLSMSQTVVDLTYGPRETALIAAARSRGAATVDGLEVLVRQGAASLSIWTGKAAPLEAMRRAARGS